MSWFGLGKKRSRFGKMLDKEDITQEELSKVSKVGHTTISKLCNDDDYTPKYSTGMNIKACLKKL
jgi:DNA-binding XRE family transcriptional regulator